MYGIKVLQYKYSITYLLPKVHEKLQGVTKKTSTAHGISVVARTVMVMRVEGCKHVPLRCILTGSQN